jgi:hypothetical protein
MRKRVMQGRQGPAGEEEPTRLIGQHSIKPLTGIAEVRQSQGITQPLH